MSKQINSGASRAVAASILVGLLLVFEVALPRVSAQKTVQAPDATSASARAAALNAATSEVLKETSEIRELSILRPVTGGSQTRADIEHMLVKNLDEESSPEQLRAAELTLKKLGLVPADFQMRAFIIRILTEQAMGYYEPKTQIFYLADWVSLDEQQPVMAHELTHALQDQHFNLRRFEHWPRGDSDAELAVHALIEGDAMLTMSMYIMRDLKRAVAMLKSMDAGGASEEIDKAPPALKASLLFPYNQGMTFTQQLHKRGGWDNVSLAFKALPQSSEQILHPDKYVLREAPVKVALPDIAATLNTGSVGKWKKLDDDVQGEWGFYLVLNQFLESSEESEKAAAGWGGDHFALYEGPKGELVYVSLASWDSEADAREFFDAYVKRTELRYPQATRTTPSGAVDSVSWKTGEGNVVIQIRDKRVLAIEGLPDLANARDIVQSIWGR